jgi:hypothetical protein
MGFFLNKKFQLVVASVIIIDLISIKTQINIKFETAFICLWIFFFEFFVIYEQFMSETKLNWLTWSSKAKRKSEKYKQTIWLVNNLLNQKS